MENIKNNNSAGKGLTLIEMVMAMAIITIVFSALLPQFRNIQNSWATKQANSEILQNGRVFIKYLNRNLAQAVKITSVSDSSETNGYIEFEASDGLTYRCDIAANNYIKFGPVGNLSDLAGPVSSLQITCYSIDDFDKPETDVNKIRYVQIQAVFTNSSSRGQDKTFTGQTYLRTNKKILFGMWKLDETSGLTAADSSGNGNDGTLNNMTGNEWTTGPVEGALAFDGNNDFIDGIGDCPTGNFTVSAWVKDTGSTGDD